jgi:HK97 family phage major capsid protein
MVYTEIVEKRQQMDALYKKAVEVRKVSTDEKRSMTSEEKSKFDKIMDDVLLMKNDIEAAEKEYRAQEFLSETTAQTIKTGNAPESGNGSKKEFIRSYLRGETRAFAEGTANVGGVFMPTDVINRLEVAMKPFNPMWDNSEIIKTSAGESLVYPMANDTANSAAVVAENASLSVDSSTPFLSLTLKAYKYSTGPLQISWEMLNDVQFDVEGMVINLIAQRLGRGMNADFTTGNGSSKATGIIAAATTNNAYTQSSTTGKSGAAQYADLLNLIYKVNAAYRVNGKFMMNDNAIKGVSGLLDSSNRPIWLPNYGSFGGMGEKWSTPSLFGYPCISNLAMADPATSAYSVLFGDISRYKIRAVNDVQIIRLNELYAANGQVAFIGFYRADGNLVDAGGTTAGNPHPVWLHQGAAS